MTLLSLLVRGTIKLLLNYCNILCWYVLFVPDTRFCQLNPFSINKHPSISLRLINSKLWNRSQVIYAWQISEGCRHSSMRCLKYEQFHSFGIQEQVFMYNINLQKRMRVKYLQFNEEWRYSVSELQKQSSNSFCQQWFFKVTLPKIRTKTHLPFLCKIGIIPDFLLQMSVQLNFLGFQSVSWCFKLPNTLRLKIKHHAKVSLMINSKYACSLNLYLFS